MNYKETLDYLFGHMPMYQKIGAAAYKNNLNNTLALDNYFGHPHKKFKTIHIAGTNGKGSVSHSLASILQSAGYKVGLYTSPHLIDFRERIRINGKMVTEKFVVDFVDANKKFMENLEPSFFELSMAMAFEYFAYENVDIAVVEVGLGGRLDSTNIITPLVSVITNISFDHTQFLGDTLELIAGEKAGIIKKNIPVVIGESNARTRQVFYNKANELNAPLFLANHIFSVNDAFETTDGKKCYNVFKNSELVFANLKLDLLGDYQKHNVCTVLQTIEVLQTKNINITNQNIYEGFAKVVEKTGLLGRWQIINKEPLTVCDTGHNEAGIEYVVNQIKNQKFDKLHIVLGTVNDKDINKILKFLPKEAEYYFTKASIPRALNEKELKSKAEEYNLYGNSFSNVKAAFEAANTNAKTNDMIFVGGSNFVVAEVL